MHMQMPQPMLHALCADTIVHGPAISSENSVAIGCLQDLGQLPWAAALIRKTDKLVMFMRNHQFTQSLLREFATKQLLKPAVTRFGTNLIMIERLIDQKEALQVSLLSRSSCSTVFFLAAWWWYLLHACICIFSEACRAGFGQKADWATLLCLCFAMMLKSYATSQCCLAENCDRQAMEGMG